MPALEALLGRFADAHTQPLGLSIDSHYCHANWAQSLGGVSFPLLSDFHPKGGVAQSYGLYLDKFGITDRATVIIDAGGTVRYVKSVTPAGQRDMEELAAECAKVHAAYDGELASGDAAEGIGSGDQLYIKSSCGFSRAVLQALANLHVGDDALPIRNVTEDPAAMAELKQLTGKEQAPCFVSSGEPMFESKDIIRHLVTRVTGLWPAE